MTVPSGSSIIDLGMRNTSQGGNAVKRRIIAMMAATAIATTGWTALSAGNAHAEVREMCALGQLPSGFLVTNTLRRPGACGGVFPITAYNIWVIESYTDKQVGDYMSVCSNITFTDNPAGWITVSTSWSPTTCQPNSGNAHNVRLIQRVA